jgi:hypothetical protein
LTARVINTKVLRKVIYILFIIIYSSHSYSQVFNYIFQCNFENNTLGSYSDSEWGRDWNYPVGASHDYGYGQILQDNSKYLRENFPQGSFFFDGSGVQWWTMLPNNYNELYFSYRLRISDGFQIDQLDTKLPGLAGGASNGGGNLPTGTDGWSARLLMKSGTVYFYLYHPELYLVYGDVEPDPAKTYWGESVLYDAGELQANTWYVITQRIVMNTPGNHDGIAEGYLNGKLVAQRTGLRFRDIEELAIDRIYFSNFLGGSGEAPKKDEFIDYDDFCVYTYTDNIDVPRGNTPSARGYELILPYKDYFDQNWIKSLQANAKSASSITLSWQPYMYDITYYLDRKLATETNFTQIATLNYAQKTYTDQNLRLATGYVYRLRAGEIVSNEKTATTMQFDIPASPSNLVIQSTEKRSLAISWKDNSSLESGFKIYRSTSPGTGYSLINSVASNITVFSSTGLSPGTSYYFKVTAYNQSGESAYSNEVSASTLPLDVPATPTNLYVDQVTKSSVRLKWNDNASNESGYTIVRSSSPNFTTSETFGVAFNSTEFNDNALTTNTFYYYRVFAYNTNGPSGFSNFIEVKTTDTHPPSPPFNLVINSMTKKSIGLEWTDTSAFTMGFELERSQGSDGNFVAITALNYLVTSYTDKSVLPGTHYFYRIRSSNYDAYSSYSNYVDTTTLLPYPPLAPVWLNPDTINYFWVILKWADKSINESGFEIERVDSTAGNSNRIFTVAENQTTFTDYELRDNTKYCYRIRSFNEDGLSDYSPYLFVYTPELLPPESPSNLKISERSTNYLSLNWQDNSTDESGFVIKRASAPDFEFVDHKIVNANDTFYVDKNLAPSTTYLYKLTAINNAGKSPESNKINAATMSLVESKRSKDGLIAYYNFIFDPDFIIHDISGVDPPLDLISINPNNIEWTTDNKLKVINNTIITSPEPALKIVNACKETNEISIECWVKSSIQSLFNNSKIISLSSGNDDLGFCIGQINYQSFDKQAYNYFVQLNTESTSTSGLPYLKGNDNLEYVSMHQIVYVRDSLGNELIYLDGEKIAEGFRPMDFSPWTNQYYLNLANERNMEVPWFGTYYLVAIYNQALDKKTIRKYYSIKPSDSIMTNHLNLDMTIYPNPTDGIVNVEIIPKEEFDYTSLTYLKLINLQGTVFHSELLFNPESPCFKSFDLSKYPKGMYMLQLVSGSNYISQRIIIQ